MSNNLRAFGTLVFPGVQALGVRTVCSLTLPPEVQRHTERVITCLQPKLLVEEDSHPCATLHIPGVSIKVLHEGASWGRGCGCGAQPSWKASQYSGHLLPAGL